MSSKFTILTPRIALSDIFSPTDVSPKADIGNMHCHTKYKTSLSEIQLSFEGLGDTVLGEDSERYIRFNLSIIINQLGWEGTKKIMLRYGDSIGKLALGYYGDSSQWKKIQATLEEKGFTVCDMSLSGNNICIHLAPRVVILRSEKIDKTLRCSNKGLQERVQQAYHRQEGSIQSKQNLLGITSPMSHVKAVIEHFNSLEQSGTQNSNCSKTSLLTTHIGTPKMSFHPHSDRLVDETPANSPDHHFQLHQESTPGQKKSPAEATKHSLQDEQGPVPHNFCNMEPMSVGNIVLSAESPAQQRQQHHMNWKQELRLIRGLLRLHDTEGEGSFGEADLVDPFGTQDARMLSKALQTAENLALRVELGVKGGKIGTSVIEPPRFQNKSKATKMLLEESRLTNALGTPLRTKLNPHAALVAEQTLSSPSSPHYLHQHLPTLSSTSKRTTKYINTKTRPSIFMSADTAESSTKTGYTNCSPAAVIRPPDARSKLSSKPSPTQTQQVLAPESSPAQRSLFRLLAQPPKRKPPTVPANKLTQQSTSTRSEMAFSSDKTQTALEIRTRPGPSHFSKPKPKPACVIKGRQGRTEHVGKNPSVSAKNASNPVPIATATHHAPPKPQPLCELGLPRMNVQMAPIAAPASSIVKSSRIPRPAWPVPQQRNRATLHNSGLDEKGIVSSSSLRAKSQIVELRECQERPNKLRSPYTTKKIGTKTKSGPKGNNTAPKQSGSSVKQYVSGEARASESGTRQRKLTRQA